MCLFQNLLLNPSSEGTDDCVKGVVDHIRKFIFGKLIQIDGIPVWLLDWRTVIASNDYPRISLTKGLTGKSCAFQREFIRVKLGEDLSVYLIAYREIPKGMVFVCLGFLKTVFSNIHNFNASSFLQDLQLLFLLLT